MAALIHAFNEQGFPALTYSSWLNLIECQFQALRSFALNRSDYQSRAEQEAAIRAYLRWHNRNARPAKPWRLKAEVHHSLPDVAARGTSGRSLRCSSGIDCGKR